MQKFKSVKTQIGVTGSGKAIYNAKQSKGFTQEDLADALALFQKLAHTMHCEAVKYRWRTPEQEKANFGFTKAPEYYAYAAAKEAYEDLSDYFYRKFKAMQNGVKTYREGDLRRGF
jgi:hypothetical protein